MQHPLIQQIFDSKKVIALDGSVHDLRDGLDKNEGAALYDLITENQLSKTLEVGCAYGISSLYICSALASQKSPHHIIIDPNQYTAWHGVGIANLQRSKYDFFSLIEKPSELALPALLESGQKFQLILIDGWHTLDHTLLDFFYANRLLEVGGFIAIDDAAWPGIRKAIQYISNYPNYTIHRTVNVAPPAATTRNLLRRSVDAAFRFAAKSLPPIYSSEVFTEQYRTDAKH